MSAQARSLPAAIVVLLFFLFFLFFLSPLVAQQSTPDFAFLGVNTEQIRPGDDKSGVKVTYLFPGASAERIGLKVGDEIIALNDFLIPNTEVFIKQLRREKAPSADDPKSGSTVRFLIRRDGQRLKLKGKIGSYQKTMSEFQNRVRQQMIGKPLPPLPTLKWWDSAGRRWVDKKDGLAHLKGNLSVLIAFDNCAICTRDRYDKFVKMKQVLQATQREAPLAFAGIYQSDAQESRDGQEKLFQHARALFEKIPPNFPVAVAYYPDGRVSPVQREKQFHIHNHGVVILDPKGMVRYVQIHGIPQREFLISYQKLVQEYAGSKKDPGDP